MELTELQKLHYDAIKSLVQDLQINDDAPIEIIGIDAAAQACAKITEREKLKFAIEMIKDMRIACRYTHDIAILNKKLNHLQQQLNELTR